MSKLISSTQFINVMVKVKAGAQPGQYIVQSSPAAPCATQPDTVINYQIYDCGDHDIVFTGMTPTPNDQLSAASVSISGKLLTFSDANNKKTTVAFTLQFKDKDGVTFMHDPQIINEPQQ